MSAKAYLEITMVINEANRPAAAKVALTALKMPRRI